MTTDPYVPTTDEARSYFLDGYTGSGAGSCDESDAEFDRFIAKIRAEAWDEGVKAVRDWWETPDDEKYVILNPYGTHPADRLLDGINANGDDNE